MQALYEFGPFRLNVDERLLLREGTAVPLTPKAFDVLLALVEQPGHLLEKETLLKAVWPDSFVEEGNLTDNISKLRKALGEGENGQKFIETVPKRGYRFVVEVRKPHGAEANGLIAEATALTDSKEPPAAAANEVSQDRRRGRSAILLSALVVLVVALIGIGSRLYLRLERGAEMTQLEFKGDFYRLVKDWAKLPPGWNFGECSGVATDKQDNVWVFTRGAHPVLQFDRGGKFLQAWPDIKIISSHGIRVDPEGNVWLVEVKGHVIFKCNAEGRVLMGLDNRQGTPGNNDSKDSFNEPTSVAFDRQGNIYVSDGYVSARVVKFNRDGEYLTHWGRKGTGDGEFNLVHDVVLDAQERVIVADRFNQRIQIFDKNGKFLEKWTEIGAPWGLAYSAKENCVYMCDGVNNRIVKLSMDGKILGTLSGYGKAPGKLDFAHHLALDSTGALYVAEIKNWRVQKFASREAQP